MRFNDVIASLMHLTEMVYNYLKVIESAGLGTRRKLKAIIKIGWVLLGHSSVEVEDMIVGNTS